ncbi:hypothetical protein PV08_01873 [Exophiala spinifera]|uniref:Uncharacterized protein n=1 Tax=Exophiala spinifera TaxID=91928 RepID=A0A0D2BQM3_9EURO|nr:uncharacterized protein PV08_01873 [Exophiala spinifera]KIW21293.1 hypothetical protein PV08_01873 [Exophiala spinifera]
MAELDSLIDSMISQRKAGEVNYIDDKYADTIKVEAIPSKGQGVFAQRPLSVKDALCSLAIPTTLAIDAEYLPTTCYHCLIVTSTQLPLKQGGTASASLKDCGGCRKARFCSRECQVEAWHAYHKFECKVFKKVQNDLPPPILRAVLRVVLLKDRNKIPEDEWTRISSLTSHEHILAGRGRSNITDMAEGIKHLAESSMTVELIQRLIFIMRSNTIELPTPIHGPMGVMLEPLVAKFNHSCEPNLAIHRPQFTMKSRWMKSESLSEDQRQTYFQLIPLRDIQQGEELCISYVVPTVAVDARRKKLLEDYLFECNCPRCKSDTEASAELSKQHPSLPGQFEQWIKDVGRHLGRVSKDPSSLQKAGSVMTKSDRFYDHPTLYTTGDYPEIAMTIIFEALKGQAFDEALVNSLRLYFLVNPVRLVGRHNPTNLYTIFLMLDIFDAVLGINAPAGASDDKVKQWQQRLAERGLSKNGLIYWRQRICTDLRRRLESSAADDLLVLVDERDEQAKEVSDKTNQDIGTKEGAKSAEEEMRAALKMKEQKWTEVLQETGC